MRVRRLLDSPGLCYNRATFVVRTKCARYAESDVSMVETFAPLDKPKRPERRLRLDRILIVLALAAIVVGLLWGQALTTWFNATLL